MKLNGKLNVNIMKIIIIIIIKKKLNMFLVVFFFFGGFFWGFFFLDIQCLCISDTVDFLDFHIAISSLHRIV